MKYLTIIRHAKSSWEKQQYDDLVRPLNERGIKAIPIIGKYLAQQKIQPDAILSSPATRALHTCIGIAAAIKFKKEDIETYTHLYFDNCNKLVDFIKTFDNNANDIFWFGHEPTSSDLIEFLTGDKVSKFPTLGVYRIELNINNWTEIKKNSGNKVLFISPKLLNIKEDEKDKKQNK